MFKAPVPGLVKTRLIPPLSPHEAAELYRCFLQDIFSKALRLEGVDLYAAWAPEAGGQALKAIPLGFEPMRQKGRGLGQRMRGIFCSLFTRGYESVVLIGSDSPDLPLAYVREAFRQLEGGSELALGPSRDGGYYLIGLSQRLDWPFEGIAWSTDSVLEQTLSRARQRRAAVGLLRPWHDIDTADDLRRLRRSWAPATSALLGALGR